MTQLNKAVLLFLSCALPVLIAGCGSSSTPPPAPNGFLYAANSFRPGSMSAFNVTEGALSHITGSPFVTTGNAPYSAAAVSTKFLYAGIPATPKGGVITRVLGRTLSGSVTGGILLMPIKNDHTLDVPQMFASGGDYDPIAVTPNGNFLYAADLSSNRLAAFSLDSSKGTLAGIGPQGPQPGVAVGPDPFNVIIDTQGKFVFVANCDFTSPSNKGSVSVFSINSDGTLSPLPGVPSSRFLIGGGASHPVALALSPDNQFLFVASLDDKVYVESITNGTLADAGAVSLPAGSTPVSIAVSSDGGNSVYTGNAGTHNVSFLLNCWQTGQTGCVGVSGPLALQATGGASVGGTVGVILADPTSIAATSTTSAINPGHFLYVTDYDHGMILVFSVTSTTTCSTWPNTSSCTTIPGTLAQSGSAVNTGGTSPFGLALAH